MASTPYQLRCLGGGPLTTVRPTVLQKEYLLLVNDKEIAVHALKTGQRLGLLRVPSSILHISDRFVACENGSVYELMGDLKKLSSVQLKRWRLCKDPVHLVVQGEGESIFGVTHHGSNTMVWRMKFVSDGVEKKCVRHHVCEEMPIAFFNVSGNHILVRPTAILIFGVGKKPRVLKVDGKNPITSAACNGSDLACGHKSGCIRIHNNVLGPSPVTRQLHWHAHAVSSMVYDSSNILYSVGDESVLITWNLARGTDAPSNVLPRMALDGLDHVSVPTNGRILVTGKDSSMQLIEAHSQQRVWKMQGLALAAKGPCVLGMDAHHRCYYLSSAPGVLHYYDRDQVKEVQTLAPYNRISQTNDEELPAPVVTHVAISGSTMLTIDTLDTDPVGLVTTLRFWQGKQLRATMSHPHGTSSPILAIALSGDHACTVSDEDIRLWLRHNEQWGCRCKIRIPSGFANYRVSGVTYSSDGSLLATAFGPLIALWDHEESSLVATLSHGKEEIVGLDFMQHDQLVSWSNQSIQCVVRGWNWSTKERRIAGVTKVEDQIVLAVVGDLETELIWLDAWTGDRVSDLKLPGKVVNLTAGTKKGNKWDKIDDASDIYAATEDGRLYHVYNHALQAITPWTPKTVAGPTLRVEGDSRAKRPLLLSRTDLERTELPTKVPRLDSSWTWSFVSRHLQRKDDTNQ